MSTKTRKTYGQFCPVGHALDVVGDRWSLLLIRELLGGPARFNELHTGLPGIAKNLLIQRLKQLETDGIIRKLSNKQYALTDLGESIRPILEQLAFWSLKIPRVSEPIHERSVRAVAMAIHAGLGYKDRARTEKRYVVELSVDDEPIEIILGEKPSATVRPALSPDVRLWVSTETMNNLFKGKPLTQENVQLVSGEEALKDLIIELL